MDIYSKERLEQVMNDMKTKVLPQIKSEIEKRAKKNIGIHNEATCSTTAGTAAKAVIAPSGFELSAGATIIVTFTNAISVTNATLTFGTAVDDTAEDYAEKNPSTEGWYVLSSGDFTPTQDTEPQSGTTYYIVSAAKPIYYRGAALPANLVKAGMSLIMRYNGTQCDIISNIEVLDNYLQVNAQNFSNAQKLQARENINAQEKVTDMAKLGCGIGTCSTSSGTALTVDITNYELVVNGIVMITFENDVPAEATLNINGQGAKAIYYKGTAITADTIKADDTVMFCYDGTNYIVTSLGGDGGGSSTFPEFVTIQLSSTEGDNDQNLIGATIVVTNDDTSATILSTTWQGEDIPVQVDAEVNYTVTVGNITDYIIRPNYQSYTAVSGISRIIKFKYVGNTVDLGLPSGVLWCSKNYTASSPEQYGTTYFSPGNIEGHPSTYQFSDAQYQSSRAYQAFGSGGTFSADSGYDAARENMGYPWRIPTREECNEMIQNCIETYETINGKNVAVFTSKINGNRLIIPLAGEIYNGTYYYDGTIGVYPTTSTSYSLDIRNDQAAHVGSGIPRNGMLLRAVC